MDTADEFFHEPTDEEYWSESHYLDVIDKDEDIAFHTRVGFYPNRDAANVFAYLISDEMVYWLREESVAPSDTHGLVAETDEWAFRMLPVEPSQEWTVTVEGEVMKASADDPGAVLEGRGEKTEIEVEIVSESRHDPFYYSDGETFPLDDNADRYEVATRVEGTATVGDRTRSFEGVGERDHSWGRRKWAGDAEWLWISGAFEDGTAFNHLSFWLSDFPDQRMVNGFWYDGEKTHPITDAEIDEEPSFGEETARGWMFDGTTPEIEMTLRWDGGSTTIDIDVEPEATTPLDWVDEDRGQRAVLNRSVSRQKRETGAEGSGFLENMTQIDHGDGD